MRGEGGGRGAGTEENKSPSSIVDFRTDGGMGNEPSPSPSKKDTAHLVVE